MLSKYQLIIADPYNISIGTIINLCLAFLIKKQKKIGGKDGKALYKLMNNIVCCKTMENVRNRMNVTKKTN